MASLPCDNCGKTDALLLTRQNPKGVTGIFWCEECTGKTHVVDQESAIMDAIESDD